MTRVIMGNNEINISHTSARVSRRDLARAAGVVPSVVTAVLGTGSSNVRVSADTRDRIRRLAKEMGYRPDFLARSLAKRKSFLIAMICTDVMGRFVWEVATGVEEAAGAQGYSMLLSPHAHTLEDECSQLQRALERHIDAIVVWSVLDPVGRTNAEVFEVVRKRGVPVVQVMHRTMPGILSVMDDEVASATQATRHLINLGHRRILHLTKADYMDRVSPGREIDARLRYEGYYQEMERAGLESVVLGLQPVPNTYQQARDMAGMILEHPSRPTAVFCFSDYRALGLINGLVAMGVDVPGRMSVVGYDDLPEARHAIAGLTTVRPNRIDIGRQAAQMVLAMLEGDLGEDRLTRSQLIVRDSTAGPWNEIVDAY